MAVHEVSLAAPVPASYHDEISRRLFFVAEEIVDFSIPVADGEVRVVRLELASDGRAHEVADEVRRAIVDIANHNILPQKVAWRSEKSKVLRHDVFERLLERGDAVEVGDGQVAFGGRLISLLDYFDGLFRSIAIDGFGAVEYRYPTLIATRTLEDADYFRSFPQFLMLVTRLHNDSANYRSFEDFYATRALLDGDVLDYCRNVEQSLPPTMCYHTYAQFRGARLQRREHRVVTSVGKSFRFESRYARTLERLWDFTIREIVFIGSRNDVLRARQEFMERSIAVVSGLGLEGRCEVANDPFFCSSDAATRVFTQRLMELKYELQLDTEPGRSIAAASFNFHLDHFGSSFDITEADGSPANTACVGFGLERVVFAFLSQYGLSESEWPRQVREGAMR